MQDFAAAKARARQIHQELLFLHQELPARAAKLLEEGIEIVENNFEETPELLFQQYEVTKAQARPQEEQNPKRNGDAVEKRPGTSPVAINSEEFGKAALMSMMSGVLEPKREELLREEIPVPLFVLNKPREEWDANDETAFSEYEKKVMSLEQEREEYKMELLTEMEKMELDVAESKREFDASLESLASLKVEID